MKDPAKFLDEADDSNLPDDEWAIKYGKRLIDLARHAVEIVEIINELGYPDVMHDEQAEKLDAYQKTVDGLGEGEA